MTNKEFDRKPNEKQSSFSRNKGFYLLVFCLFAFYQSSSWFIEHWFAKRELRDSRQMLAQKMAEMEKLEVVKLEINLPKAKDENIGSPEIQLDQIFNGVSKSFYKTQELPEKSLKELQDYIEFKLYHKHNPLLELDMKHLNSYLLQLLNLYAIEGLTQHPEIRDKNINVLKTLFKFHKDTAKRVYQINDEVYKKAFPVNDSFIKTPTEEIANAFINEYKLKSSKNSYLLGIGGDDLLEVYLKVSDGSEMPFFVERNVLTLNRYIHNLNHKAQMQ